MDDGLAIVVFITMTIVGFVIGIAVTGACWSEQTITADRQSFSVLAVDGIHHGNILTLHEDGSFEIISDMVSWRGNWKSIREISINQDKED